MTTTYDLAYVRREEEPVLAPPRTEVGVIGWLRANLFSSTTNTILTLLGLVVLFWTVPPIVRWAFIDAVWTGSDRDACLATEGACWAFVRARFGQFMYGRYPLGERWRVDLTAILLIAGLIPMAIPRVPYKRATIIYLLLIFPVIALVLLTGGHFRLSLNFLVLIALLGCLVTGVIALFATRQSAPILGGIIAPGAAALTVVGSLAAIVAMSLTPGFSQGILLAAALLITLASAVVAAGAGATAMFTSSGLPGVRLAGGVWMAIAIIAGIFVLITADFDLTPVETSLWGGLLVTLVVAVVGMVGSFPLGVLLALGRRSRMPVVRMLSVTFIEFVRGVPLITMLFMASVMLPIFLPPGVTFDKLLRALIGVALFEAAYLAEVVRAGLQAIPRGQYEAAQAMGLTYWQMMRLIILPQALKIVIPGIVNSFISLFKDTSLVLIIGIFDLLGIVQLGFTDANWAAPNTPMTGYIFAGVVFWLFCFGMSRYSIYTERRLSTGRRI